MPMTDDLYHAGDGLISIVMRLISGFTGNLVIINICCTYEKKVEQIKNELYWDVYIRNIYDKRLCFSINESI